MEFEDTRQLPGKHSAGGSGECFSKDPSATLPPSPPPFHLGKHPICQALHWKARNKSHNSALVSWVREDFPEQEAQGLEELTTLQ